MSTDKKLGHPWLVAVWPGMGHVAISAGYYLMAKLGMHLLAEFSPRELFDVEHIEVKGGLVHTGRLPRSRFFVWKDPAGRRDIVVFIGEAQPPLGKYGFCHKLIEFAQELGVEHVFTFAAMVTQMDFGEESRVFGAATDQDSLAELRRFDLEILEDGQISGLNGILLGVAAEMGLPGGCLLGEMPHLFAQLPFPQASLAVLQAFTRMAEIEIDLEELQQQSDAMGRQLGEILARVQRAFNERTEVEEDYGQDQPADDRISPEDERQIEDLFERAKQDRSKAYELKGELDRLGVFADFEDRFLDLFKKPEA